MAFRHIFIVGCDRTGTTLVVTTLNRHQDICVSSQTHYMGHLARSGFRQKMKEFGDLQEDETIHKLTEFVYKRPFAGGDYWFWVLKNVEREEFTNALLASDRTEPGIFSALMQLRARNGEQYIGEKTPDHIQYVPILKEWYPNAKFIHTFRDPRAIFVSEFGQRWKAPEDYTFPYKYLRSFKPLYSFFVLLHMSLEWFLVVRYHFRYKEQFAGDYHLLKFENFISQPEEEIRKLCQFLEVDFQEQMLEQKIVNTSFFAEEGRKGFNKKAIERWRDHIDPFSKLWFSLWAKRYLKEFGYSD